jgi:hypothetical protein
VQQGARHPVRVVVAHARGGEVGVRGQQLTQGVDVAGTDRGGGGHGERVSGADRRHGRPLCSSRCSIGHPIGGDDTKHAMNDIDACSLTSVTATVNDEQIHPVVAVLRVRASG